MGWLPLGLSATGQLIRYTVSWGRGGEGVGRVQLEVVVMRPSVEIQKDHRVPSRYICRQEDRIQYR